jgi:cation diffusion facilitator CzcD-associated flavoprotein CzcO
MTPSNAYYPALAQPNVTLVTNSIESFTPTGIRSTNGDVFEFDVVVMATGFEVLKVLGGVKDVGGTKHFVGAKVIGREGKNLGEIHGNAPQAYKGSLFPKFPNLFQMLGPNSGYV